MKNKIIDVIILIIVEKKERKKGKFALFKHQLKKIQQNLHQFFYLTEYHGFYSSTKIRI